MFVSISLSGEVLGGLNIDFFCKSTNATKPMNNDEITNNEKNVHKISFRTITEESLLVVCSGCIVFLLFSGVLVGVSSTFFFSDRDLA